MRACAYCGEMFKPRQWDAARPNHGRFCSVSCARRRTPLAVRFWQCVDKDGECWPWMGSRSAAGYGRIVSIEKGIRAKYAHRIAWELTHGQIPAGMHVCHRCDNPPCCNPTHLFLGTPADNVTDAKAKGRMWFQRQTGRTRLTPDGVREIRRLRADGIAAVTVAKQFGISTSHVYNIAGRRERVDVA